MVSKSAILKVESLQKMRLRPGFKEVWKNSVVFESGATVMSLACAKPSQRNLVIDKNLDSMAHVLKLTSLAENQM